MSGNPRRHHSPRPAGSRPYAAVTASPHASTSPVSSASTAPREVARRPRQLGQPTRTEAHRGRRQPGPTGPLPRPRAGDRRCQHRGDGPDVDQGRRPGGEERDGGDPRPVGVGNGLDHPCLVGDDDLRYEHPVGPTAHRRGEPSELDGRSVEPPLGERDRPFAPVATTGVDQTAGHERGAVTAFADRRHEAVVLVAEVGGQADPITEQSGGPQSRQPRHAEAVGHDVAPRAMPWLLAVCALEDQRAHEDLGVEDRLGRPPRPRDRSHAVDFGADSTGVTRGEDRLREDEADAPAVGTGEADGEGEELDGSIGVRTSAVPARPAPARRRRQLR